MTFDKKTDMKKNADRRFLIMLAFAGAWAAVIFTDPLGVVSFWSAQERLCLSSDAPFEWSLVSGCVPWIGMAALSFVLFVAAASLAMSVFAKDGKEAEPVKPADDKKTAKHSKADIPHVVGAAPSNEKEPVKNAAIAKLKR